MNRRVVLRGIGGLALAAPFLSSLREARGEEAAPPKRLVIFYTHNGCITDKWWPALEDGPLRADTFAGTTLEVLQPHYEKLLLPRGFRSMNSYAVGQSIDPHDQAMGSKLTCATISDDRARYATAESLDHTIAKQINPQGAKPLVLSVGAASTSIKEVLSFSGPDAAFPANTNPRTVYSALIGPTGPTPGTDGPYSEAEYHVRRGQSVIDLVRADLTRLQKLKMSQADRQRTQDWLDLLRDTEVGVGSSVAACGQENAARLGIRDATLDATVPTRTETGVDLGTAFTLGGDMMMNLMALSMICDTNRSLILTYPGYVIFNWDGINHTYDHAALSNRTGSSSVGGYCVENAVEHILEIDRWYAGKFARLVGLLDSIDEGSGTLLDNTATMWLPELSDGAAHNLNNLPILIAGSAGGYLKQGYAVNVEGAPIGLGRSSTSCVDDIAHLDPGSGSSGGDVPINKLYVTLMNAVGCTDAGDKVTQFGQFDGLAVDSGISDPGEVTALTAAG